MGLPRTYGIAILEGHDAGDLMDVGEVMRGPRGEQLREADDAEAGMTAVAGDARRLTKVDDAGPA